MVKKKASAKGRAGFDELNGKLDRVIDAMATRRDTDRIAARIDALEEKFERRFNSVMNAIDALAKTLSDLTLEYSSIKIQLARHEKWFRLLARKSDVKLLL